MGVPLSRKFSLGSSLFSFLGGGAADFLFRLRFGMVLLNGQQDKYSFNSQKKVRQDEGVWLPPDDHAAGVTTTCANSFLGLPSERGASEWRIH